MKYKVYIESRDLWNHLMCFLEQKDYLWLSGNRPTDRYYDPSWVTIHASEKCISLDNNRYTLTVEINEVLVNKFNL